jgi:hypothetical protein
MSARIEDAQWEYVFAWTEATSDDDKITQIDGLDRASSLGDSSTIPETIRTLGSEGWELVSVDRKHYEHVEICGGTRFGRHSLMSKGVYIFKRLHR